MVLMITSSISLFSQEEANKEGFEFLEEIKLKLNESKEIRACYHEFLIYSGMDAQGDIFVVLRTHFLGVPGAYSIICPLNELILWYNWRNEKVYFEIVKASKTEVTIKLFQKEIDD